MATPIKDKLVNLEILKSSQDYIDNKKINKNQGIENNGKFMRVGADGNLVPDDVPIQDVSGQIKEHNENADSHQDIRTELKKKANSGTTLSDYGITDAVPDSHLTDSKAHEDIRKETAKLKEDLSQLSEEINNLPSVGGMTQAQITALDGMFKKCAFTGDVTAEYMAFKQAFGIESGGEVEPDNPEVTLTSISATYTGGSVAVGTALTSLTGITVTATYSDGSTASVTGYTLSGTIAEGSNKISVSYGGKTTTFTVVGYVEQEEPTTNSLLTDLQTYAINVNLAPMGLIEKSGNNYDISLNTEYTGVVNFQNSRIIGSANLSSGKTYKLSISNIVSQIIHLYAYDELEYKDGVISTTQGLSGSLIATLARETTEVTFTVESDYKYLRLALVPPVTLENLMLEEV